MQIRSKSVDEIIELALSEDIGTGDVTTFSIVPPDAETHAYILAKQDGVLAGITVAERVFQLLDPKIVFDGKKVDGEKIFAGDILAQVSGSATAILIGERVALNLLQRMSGIATKTAKLVEKIAGFPAVVVDTRKTAPGLRILDKYAVKVGGGCNHRFGLYDGILIKDNHIKVAGGIKSAVEKARAGAPHTLKVEVEVESLEAVRAALEAGAEVIMLDNMSVSMVKEAMEMINGRARVEVSGGVNEDNILEYAKIGVDIISAGRLTHSVQALDISIDIKEIKVRK